ncbi:MAG: hypothetical protein COX83_00675, partial [Candidatus Magasanikbacteria bacterium CG_4_10_14_0_2_um_filter_41_31]
MDYSGMSMFGKYDPSSYVYFIDSDHRDNGAYLAYQMSNKFFVNRDGERYSEKGCSATGSGGVLTKDNGDPCGFDGGGRCYSQSCLYPINGVFTNIVSTTQSSVTEDKDTVIKENVDNMLAQLIHGSCKSFPEPTAPFDTDLAIIGEIVDGSDNNNVRTSTNPEVLSSRREYTNINNTYSSANICQFDGTSGGNCSCEYFKVEYKNGTIDYWPTEFKNIPAGICSGSGDRDGDPCTQDTDCQLPGGVGSGICYKQKQKGTYIGTKGLCLEDDLSRPLLNISKNSNTYQKFACLTWLPIQVSASAYDLYNTALQAGYYPVPKYDSTAGGLAYCKEAQSVAGSYDKTMVREGYMYDTPKYLNNHDISETPLPVGLVNYANANGEYAYNGNDYLEGLFSTSVFNSGKNSYTATPGSGVDTYFTKSGSFDSPGRYYKRILTEAKNNLDARKAAYKTMQVWGWKNLSTSARLLRLDLQNDDGKEFSMFRYPEDILGATYAQRLSDGVFRSSVVAMFSFAPVLQESSAEDTGAAMHPPRLWTETFPVPKENPATFEYFSNTNASEPDASGEGSIPKHDLDFIETSAYSPDFDATSDDNKYIYVDSNVESKINEYMLDRVYFVPIIFPDGAEGQNPAILNNQFYIDFNNLREKLKNDNLPIESHDAPDCSGNAVICSSSAYKQIVTSYLLERNIDQNDTSTYGGTPGSNGFNDDCRENGLVSFCKYGNQFLPTESIKPNNQIYRRYVTVFNYSNKNSNSEDILPDAKNDPFTRFCTSGGKQNFMAIGMDFNKNGEFLGYISRWCNNYVNDDGEGNGISFATFAQFANVCTDVVSVVDEDSQQLVEYNKAWTDRVTKGSNSFSGLNGLPILPLTLSSDIAPYASLEAYMNQKNLNVNDVSELPAYIRFYSFPQGDTNKYGTPYNCGNQLFPGSSVASGASTDACGKSPNSADSLKLLFNKYYTEWQIPANKKLTSLSNPSTDFSGTNLGDTKPPKIFAIDYLTCDNKQSGLCPAVSEGFTINSRNYPTNPSDPMFSNEDKDISGATDPIIVQGSYKAVARFYAYADDNRMPIKRVLVNWKDGSFIYDVIGDYQNRKPYCATTDNFVYSYDSQSDTGLGRCVGTQLTCMSQVDCKSAGPNGTAVLCINPSDPSGGHPASGFCSYQNNVTPTYGNACQNDDDCNQQGQIGVCLPNGTGGQCQFTPIQQSPQETNTACHVDNDCPDENNMTKTCHITTPSVVVVSEPSHFGDSARACIAQDPFEATHTYSCDLTNASYPKYTLAEIKINTDNMFGSLRNGEE